MTLEIFASKIHLQKDAVLVIKSLREALPSRFFDYRAFINDPQNCFKEIEGYSVEHSMNKHEIMLSVCCYLGLYSHEYYRARGIEDSIYFDTFKDISIWAEDCFSHNGIWGLKEFLWLQHHISLNLFRLGRLQFLPERSEKDYCLPHHTIRKGDTLIGVHIPKDGRLDHNECTESYKRARMFFKDFEAFFCNSWLLNPKLKLFLNDESNIIKFQNDYTLFEENLEIRQAEERVFFTLCDNPADYPEKTLLQKRIKEYLISGNRIGTVEGLTF